jgi:hypothetical protein
MRRDSGILRGERAAAVYILPSLDWYRSESDRSVGAYFTEGAG